MTSTTPNTINTVQLTFLFSTPYLLAYAIPLLLLSLLLTFSGAFLTLDRTRTFSPRSDAVEKNPGSFKGKLKAKTFPWLLEGGIGGLAAGYVFGLHASTFLALLIMNTTGSTPLGRPTFLVVWLLSVIPTTLLAGRWKYAALTCIGIAGGATLSLALCIIMHPSLLTRVVLVAIITPLALLSALLPIPRTQHIAVRTLASSLGAFGAILAIALVAHPQIPSWANAWERLWTPDSTQWGTSAEHGLDAAFCALWALGSTCDWLLKRQFGENPDEKWDAYLADYAANLPNARNRAGNFQPLQSWWSRLTYRFFPPHTLPRGGPILFPSDDMLKPTTSRSFLEKNEEPHFFSGSEAHVQKRGSNSARPMSHKARSMRCPDDNTLVAGVLPALRPAFLAKSSKTPRQPQQKWRRRESGTHHARLPVRFRPVGGFSSSSESGSDSDGEDGVLRTPMSSGKTQPRVRAAMDRQDSAATLWAATHLHEGPELDLGLDRDMLVKTKAGCGDDGHPEYSDVEEARKAGIRRPAERGDPGWKPEFLARHRTASGSHSMSSASTKVDGRRPVTKINNGPPIDTPAPAGAVPITPSLIQALGRIAAAQDEAFGRREIAHVSLPGTHYAAPSHDVAPGNYQMPVPMSSASPFTGRGESERDNIGGGPRIDGKQRWEAFWRDVTAKAAEGGVHARA